jgi:hypothetical protein
MALGSLALSAGGPGGHVHWETVRMRMVKGCRDVSGMLTVLATEASALCGSVFDCHWLGTPMSGDAQGQGCLT